MLKDRAAKGNSSANKKQKKSSDGRSLAWNRGSAYMLRNCVERSVQLWWGCGTWNRCFLPADMSTCLSKPTVCPTGCCGL